MPGVHGDRRDALPGILLGGGGRDDRIAREIGGLRYVGDLPESVVGHDLLDALLSGRGDRRAGRFVDLCGDIRLRAQTVQRREGEHGQSDILGAVAHGDPGGHVGGYAARGEAREVEFGRVARL